MATPRVVHLVCSGVLFAVLTVVLVVTMSAFDRINAKQAEIDDGAEVVSAMRGVQEAIAKGAFAEAAYLRDPSDSTRAQVVTAAQALPEQLSQARGIADPQEQQVLAAIARDHLDYVTDLTRVETPWETPVAGRLESMNRQLVTILQPRREKFYAAQAELNAMTDELRWILPGSIIGFLGTLIICWGSVIWVGSRAQRRAEAASADAGQDPLTRLANRRALAEHVAGRLADGDRPALLMFDLDRFKEVNDRWGHQAGDDLLVAVGDELRALARGDDLVARLGGDEFAIVISPSWRAESLAHKIRDAVRAVATQRGHRVTASAGIARVPLDGASLEELLVAADQRLYRAKREGPSRLPRQRLGDDGSGDSAVDCPHSASN